MSQNTADDTNEADSVCSNCNTPLSLALQIELRASAKLAVAFLDEPLTIMIAQILGSILTSVRRMHHTPARSYYFRTIALYKLQHLVKLVTEWPEYLPSDVRMNITTPLDAKAGRVTPGLEFGPMISSRQAALNVLGVIISDNAAVAPIVRRLAEDVEFIRGICRSMVYRYFCEENPLKIPQAVLAPPTGLSSDKSDSDWVKHTILVSTFLALLSMEYPDIVHDVWLEFNQGPRMYTLSYIMLTAMLKTTEADAVQAMLDSKRPDEMHPDNDDIKNIIRMMRVITQPDVTEYNNNYSIPMPDSKDRFRRRMERAALEHAYYHSFQRVPFAVCFGCGDVVYEKDAAKKMRACSRCLLVHYCSDHCQKKHWGDHKKLCNKFK